MASSKKPTQHLKLKVQILVYEIQGINCMQWPLITFSRRTRNGKLLGIVIKKPLIFPKSTAVMFGVHVRQKRLGRYHKCYSFSATAVLYSTLVPVHRYRCSSLPLIAFADFHNNTLISSLVVVRCDNWRENDLI